ncbi:MAG TPA: chemotaxis protein CheB [Kineosporiaceae bacterium]|nr:chemotaxis protein CheB [Kineosporiaceae bacterium]
MDEQAFLVIALVCSTGGLDALTRVLGPLPADFPGALLVLQHIDPTAHSGLTAIMGRRTALSVLEAAEGIKLKPGQVLVAPPGSHTLVTHQGTVALIESGARPPYRPSADLLLTSLALAVGPRAVAVVLSGHGIDGATGATAVHRFGGVVIASDEASSTEFSMPRATIGRDTGLNHVVALDDIPALLVSLAAAPEVKTTGD